MAYSLFIFVLVVVSQDGWSPVLLISGITDQRLRGPGHFLSFQLYVYFVALNRLRIIRNLEGRFEEAIIAYLFLVNLVPVIIIPMMWYEARKVAKLLNHWADFEVEFVIVHANTISLCLLLIRESRNHLCTSSYSATRNSMKNSISRSGLSSFYPQPTPPPPLRSARCANHPEAR